VIHRATAPQCLSSRVSALADGSLPDDVRDRALAHVTSCPDCRADLEAERQLRARLQQLPAPRPSASLVAALLAMGETGGPLPPRAGHVPGNPRPRPVTIGGGDAPWESRWALPGRRSTSRSPEFPARPGPTSRPSGRSGNRRRTVVGATAGALSAGVIAAALASGLPVAQRVAPPEQLHAQASSGADTVATSSAAGIVVAAPGVGAGTDVGTGARTDAGLDLGGYQGADARRGVGLEAVLSAPALAPSAEATSLALSVGSGPSLGASSGVFAAGSATWTGASAVPPGVSTTFLRHLVADGLGRSGSYLSGGYLPGASR
jgi:hypothetical protein